MRTPLIIANKKILPGTEQVVHIPVARLYTHTEMTMPVHVIHGRKEGPRLFVSGAIHGDEIIGIEIIRRLMKLKKIKSLRGSLIAVPVVNASAFLDQNRYSPDRRDLNRCFPGSQKGSFTSQLANTFMTQIVCNSDYGIDLHAGSNHRANLPQIRVDYESEEALKLAMAFQVPAVINSRTRDGSLRDAATKKGVHTILYEAGEALRFDEVAVRAGVRGILSVMTSIGMLKPARSRKQEIETMMAQSTSWVRASVSGILHMDKPLGGRVTKNSRIGFISDPFGGPEIEIHSPVSGMVIGILNLPLVHRGDAIVNIAHIDCLKKIEPIIEEFKEEFGVPPDLPPS